MWQLGGYERIILRLFGGARLEEPGADFLARQVGLGGARRSLSPMGRPVHKCHSNNGD
jgi:hypothetical protein